MVNLCICSNVSLDDHTGGVDRIINLAKNVSNNGVKVYLIDRTLKKSLSSILVDGDKYFEIINGKLNECPYPLYVRVIFPGVVKLGQEILNRLVSLLTFSVLSEVSVSFIIDPYLIVKLLFVCKKKKIDLIQSEFPTTVPSSFVAKELINVPLIYDAHNIESMRVASMEKVSSSLVAITKLMENVACVMSDRVFAVSEKDKEEFESWGISEQKINIIPNSVETDKFLSLSRRDEIRSTYGIKDEIVLIFHGPLCYVSNQEASKILVKDILPRIWEKNPNVYLLLVGKDPPKISNSRIITTGFVENLSDYISAADIAVVPLLSGGGTRIKIIEYMSAGKPIVSTQKGAEGLNLQNGVDILMTQQPNSEFVELILKLINDVVLRKKLGSNARNKAQQLFDWKVTSKVAVQTYYNIVNEFDQKH